MTMPRGRRIRQCRGDGQGPPRPDGAAPRHPVAEEPLLVYNDARLLPQTYQGTELVSKDIAGLT
ncbi:OprD family outer membrane porin [Pseudomonas bharatica]|uniref:OprD family outer membrane porin n=1 Tax=Pseudomonas bharatica TaxID=2692112 RepID=UPI004068DE84